MLVGLLLISSADAKPDAKPRALPLLSNTARAVQKHERHRHRHGTSIVHEIPRGGSDGRGPLNPDLAAKIFIYAYGLNGIHGVLFPSMHGNLYGFNDESDTRNFIIQALTSVGATVGLLFFLQKIMNLPFQEAVGWSVIPFCSKVVLKLLTNMHAKVGASARGEIVPLALNLAVCVATTQLKVDFAPALIKVYGLFSVITGIDFCFNRLGAAKRWGLTLTNPSETMVVTLCGTYLATHGTAILAPFVVGQSLVHPVIGWTALVQGVTLAAMIMKGIVGAAGIPLVLVWPWVLTLLTVAFTLIE